jgi:hypothetical protein
MTCHVNVCCCCHKNLPSFDFTVQGTNLFLDHPTGIIDDPSPSAVPSVMEPPSSFGTTQASSSTMQAMPSPNPWPQIFGNTKPAGLLPSPLVDSKCHNRRGKTAVAKKTAIFKAVHAKAMTSVRTRKRDLCRPLAPMLANTLFHYAIPTSVPLSTAELPHQIPVWCGVPLSFRYHDALVTADKVVPSIRYQALLDLDCNDLVQHLVTNEQYAYVVNDIRCVVNVQF